MLEITLIIGFPYGKPFIRWLLDVQNETVSWPDANEEEITIEGASKNIPSNKNYSTFVYQDRDLSLDKQHDEIDEWGILIITQHITYNNKSGPNQQSLNSL